MAKIPKHYQKSVELFVIGPEVVSACSMEEVKATYDDLVEMDLARPPFENFDLQFRGDVAAFALDTPLSEWTSEDHPELYSQRFCYRDGKCIDCRSVLLGGKTESMLGGLTMEQFSAQVKATMLKRLKEGEKLEDYIADGASSIEKLFVVLLATRNIVKDRVEDKLWNLGIGKKNDKRHHYTTTLRLPAEQDLIYDPEHSIGPTKRPHLRRGHIRRQRYGAALAFIKNIWIDSVFIHADENFISARTAYVIRL